MTWCSAPEHLSCIDILVCFTLIMYRTSLPSKLMFILYQKKEDLNVKQGNSMQQQQKVVQNHTQYQHKQVQDNMQHQRTEAQHNIQHQQHTIWHKITYDTNKHSTKCDITILLHRLLSLKIFILHQNKQRINKAIIIDVNVVVKQEGEFCKSERRKKIEQTKNTLYYMTPWHYVQYACWLAHTTQGHRWTTVFTNSYRQKLKQRNPNKSSTKVYRQLHKFTKDHRQTQKKPRWTTNKKVVKKERRLYQSHRHYDNQEK